MLEYRICFNKTITHTLSHAKMDDGLFCFTLDHFLTRRQTWRPCVSSKSKWTLSQGILPAANTLLGEDPSALRADQWQLLHQAADKDPQVYGMLLTLFHPNSFDFGQYSASISSWRSYWFIPNSPTQDHTSELAAALRSWARWNKSRFLDTMLFILLFQLLLKQGNF